MLAYLLLVLNPQLHLTKRKLGVWEYEYDASYNYWENSL